VISPGWGVFCSNLSSTRGPWTAHHSVWCGTCYMLTKTDRYPLKESVTDDGEEVLWRLQDKKKCRQARNLNNLLCPFQCNLCNFSNIKRIYPWVNDMTDKNLLRGIHLVDLEDFWASRSGTVESNLATMQ
jgi:hypothetical protein